VIGTAQLPHSQSGSQPRSGTRRSPEMLREYRVDSRKACKIDCHVGTSLDGAVRLSRTDACRAVPEQFGREQREENHDGKPQHDHDHRALVHVRYRAKRCERRPEVPHRHSGTQDDLLYVGHPEREPVGQRGLQASALDSSRPPSRMMQGMWFPLFVVDSSQSNGLWQSATG
jgi:hypothetical protein